MLMMLCAAYYHADAFAAARCFRLALRYAADASMRQRCLPSSFYHLVAAHDADADAYAPCHAIDAAAMLLLCMPPPWRMPMR